MSDWNLKQWTDQLKSTDRAARHEAAAMLGEEGNASVFGSLLRASIREPGYWHATDRGEPNEPDFHPLCRTSMVAARRLAPQALLADLENIQAWRAYKAQPANTRGERPDRRATPISNLIASMSNDEHGLFDPEFCARAAWALGEVGWELMGWDAYLKKDIQWDWFITLPRAQQGPVPQALIDFMADAKLSDEDALATIVEIRRLMGVEMTEMLSGLQTRREQGEPSDLAPLQNNIISSIGRIQHRDATPVIQAQLRPEWPDLHWETITALGKLEARPAATALLRMLPDTAGAMRARIAGTLGNLGERGAARALLRLLNDDDPSVRTQAARSLGRLGEPRTRDRLFQSLLDEDETVRFAVGTALGMLGDARTVPFLLRAIREGDIIVQREAEAAMTKLDKSALTALVQLLRNGKPPYRAEAARRLGALQDARAIRYLIPSLLMEDCQKEVAEALHLLGEPTVAPLIKYLKDDDDLDGVTPPLQEQVARVLGKLNDRRAVPPLITILEDKEQPPRLREEAARVLGKLGDRSAIDALIAGLNESGSALLNVRAESARSLGMLKASKARKALEEAMEELDDKLRNYAIDAVGELGDPQSVDPLIKQLNGFRSSGRSGIIQALGKIGDARAIPHLTEVAEERPITYLNGMAIQSLASLGEASVVKMILTNRRFHPEMDRALAKLGAAAIGPLVSMLRKDDNAEVRALSAAALGEMNEARTMGSLIQALQDPNADVKKAAARALARLHAAHNDKNGAQITSTSSVAPPTVGA
ncbi:MAG: HEAT repeat domain-containing protein [Myxococcota bacterium]